MQVLRRRSRADRLNCVRKKIRTGADWRRPLAQLPFRCNRVRQERRCDGICRFRGSDSGQVQSPFQVHGAEGATGRRRSDQHRQISSCRLRCGCELEAGIGPFRSRSVADGLSSESGMCQQGRSDRLHVSSPRTRSERHSKLLFPELRGR